MKLIRESMVAMVLCMVVAAAAAAALALGRLPPHAGALVLCLVVVTGLGAWSVSRGRVALAKHLANDLAP